MEEISNTNTGTTEIINDITGEDPNRPLDVTEIKVLSFIEQTFWEQGGIPSNEIVKDKLGITLKRIDECWKLASFRKALIARGINFSSLEADNAILNPHQIILANFLMNTADKRSFRQKCEAASVTVQQANGWMRQIPFQNYLRKRAEELFKSTDPVAYLSLIQNIERGNMDAIKMFFEMRGIYSPKTQVDVNLDSIMMRVVEILSRFLTAEQLQAAAQELEGVLPQKSLASSLDEPIDISSRPSMLGI